MDDDGPYIYTYILKKKQGKRNLFDIKRVDDSKVIE